MLLTNRSSILLPKMNKTQVFTELCNKLQDELNVALGASRDAADYATNEEARADSKYDTQGLEASYLAAGQASFARKVAEAVADLKILQDELTIPRSKVMRGALVRCRLDGFEEWFYICPVGGGETLEVEGVEISILTGQSPLGSSILGKTVGDRFTLTSGLTGEILEVA